MVILKYLHQRILSKIPSNGRLNKAQVQDEFYGNVGTYNYTKDKRSDGIHCMLLITKIESCR